MKAPAAITLRRATVADIPAIRRVAAVAFPATYSAILTPAQIDYMMEWMYSEASLHQQLSVDRHDYYLALDCDAAVGYVSLRRESAEVVHLEKIYVLPAYQGCHLGRRLFDHAVAVARAAVPAPQRLELNVNRYNRALGFYEHLGMRRLRAGDFDIGHGYFMNDYIMGLDL